MLMSRFFLMSYASAFVVASTSEAILGRQRMRVIGAGFGRTGTNSLKLALDELGFKTMHMFELFEDPAPRLLQRAWSKFVTTPGVLGSTLENLPIAALDELLDVHAAAGFNASMDFPMSQLYLHQLRRDPAAKVILTIRSSAEVWVDSFMETIARPTKIAKRFPASLAFPPKYSDLCRWMLTSIGMQLDSETLMPSRENAIGSYNA
eukprot:TRINITY_DN8498_c0_g1_i1.p1 TRINITY_DN8498_c0_g1~~TRINITY_DN8498_c0_g1_i1.p1  ORF type:complete len:206 (-),score=31.10 TRINITY_DN8498_c0_g1_i1:347-964(-)